MPEQDRRELRELWERVYGRDADAAGAAIALQRIEHLQRAATAASHDAPADADQGAGTGGTGSERADLGIVPGASTPTKERDISSPSTPDGPVRSSGQRSGLRWAVGAAAVGLIAGGAALASWTWARVDPLQVATLAVDPDGEWPFESGRIPGDLQRFEDFHGIPIAAGTRQRGDVSEVCIAVSPTENYGTVSCDVAAFGARTIHSVGEFPASALSDRFGAGAFVEFAYDGRHVIVRVSPPRS
ncbi:hypothetical protein [Microbacterium sp. cf332]|uniref:hypothetical protein n=1 Tax=Microbacterium sp. cf332 TaxID=1761804 RepID=UPI00115FFBC7|nr:hypothetical protein [Microbacterium sp. cf332]